MHGHEFVGFFIFIFYGYGKIWGLCGYVKSFDCGGILVEH